MHFSIVIPTYGNAPLLAKCLQSTVRLYNRRDYEIIVVDDGSSAAEQTAIKRVIDKFPNKRLVTAIYETTNKGFAAAVNKGIERAEGRTIILCNNDVIFTQDILLPLEKAFELDPQIAVVGALLNYVNNTIQHAGLVFDKITKSFLHIHKHKPNKVAASGYAIAVTGALFAIKREALEKIGGFNEQFFLACEDTDYCLRAWEKGYKVYFSRDVRAIHLEGSTRGSDQKTKARKNRDWMKKEAAGIAQFKKSLDIAEVMQLTKTINRLNSPLKKVEIGSGYSPHPGYLHLDIRKGLPQLDYVCDFSKEPLPFEDEEVSELLANHLIEHLSFRTLPFVLKEWHRVLAPGGKLILRTPNLRFICEMYLAGKTTPEWPGDESYIKTHLSAEVTPSWWAILKLFSGQDYEANFHHLCFDFPTLKSLLSRYGFTEIQEEKFDKTFSPGELQVTAKKPKDHVLLLRKGALGDVLMLTPIVDRLTLEGNIVSVETDCPEVFKYNPHVIEAAKSIRRDGKTVIDLNLAYENKPKAHIIDAYSEAVFKDRNTIHELELFGYNTAFRGDYITIHPGVSWRNRTWSIGYWQELAQRLWDTYECEIYAVGSKHDFELTAPVVDHRGKSLHDTASLIANSKFFVGIDSAPLHIAQAVGTKAYGIFTCAVPKYRTTGALAIVPDIECHGCLHEEKPPVTFCGCKRGDYKCLEIITPEQVYKEIITKEK